MKTILLSLLISISAFSQKKMVLVEGFDKQEITVTDSVSYEAVKEFYWWSNKSRVDFETDLSKLKSVQVVAMPKAKMYYYDRGVIYINSYLNDYPNFKRVVLFHAILAEIYGVPKEKGNSLDVMNEHFYVTPKYEQKYINRRTNKTDIKDAMAAFEIHKPLNTKN
jgi:hypothetical protein